MDSKKIGLIGLIACVVIALPFVNRTVFGTTAKEVNVSTLSQRVISPSILASGFLAHEEEVMLSSEVIGKVKDLYVEEGLKWIKKKYGFNSRWQMMHHSKLHYDKFFEYFPELIINKI